MRTNFLISAHSTFKKHIAAGMKGSGLSPRHYRIMFFVAKHEGCRQKDIAKHCYVETATLSTVLSNMERRGLIERRRDGRDKRAYSIFPTDNARPLYDAVVSQFKKTEEIAFAGFSEEEKLQARDFLMRIENNIKSSKEWESIYPAEDMQETGE